MKTQNNLNELLKSGNYATLYDYTTKTLRDPNASKVDKDTAKTYLDKIRLDPLIFWIFLGSAAIVTLLSSLAIYTSQL